MSACRVIASLAIVLLAVGCTSKKRESETEWYWCFLVSRIEAASYVAQSWPYDEDDVRSLRKIATQIDARSLRGVAPSLSSLASGVSQLYRELADFSDNVKETSKGRTVYEDELRTNYEREAYVAASLMEAYHARLRDLRVQLCATEGVDLEPAPELKFPFKSRDFGKRPFFEDQLSGEPSDKSSAARDAGGRYDERVFRNQSRMIDLQFDSLKHHARALGLETIE